MTTETKYDVQELYTYGLKIATKMRWLPQRYADEYPSLVGLGIARALSCYEPDKGDIKTWVFYHVRDTICREAKKLRHTPQPAMAVVTQASTTSSPCESGDSSADPTGMLESFLAAAEDVWRGGALDKRRPSREMRKRIVRKLQAQGWSVHKARKFLRLVGKLLDQGLSARDLVRVDWSRLMRQRITRRPIENWPAT